MNLVPGTVWPGLLGGAIRPSVVVHEDASFTNGKRLAGALVGVQLLLFLIAAPGYAAHGLRIDWASVVPQALAQTMLVGVWFYYQKYPGNLSERALPDAILVAALLLLLTNIASPAQYVAVALKRPLADAALAAADARLGIYVPALARWTAAHSTVSRVLTFCYFSFLAQCLLPVVVLGVALKNRPALWEYAFHFHFCLIVTLAALALFPAECAPRYYGFQPTIDQTRLVAQIDALRRGTFHVINFTQIEGLISVPSFHTAGALMVTWAFRRYRWILWSLVVVNTGLIAATFMSGIHYFVDEVAAVALFGVSVFVYRRWVIHLLYS
jgi:hypothetical protein